VLMLFYATHFFFQSLANTTPSSTVKPKTSWQRIPLLYKVFITKLISQAMPLEMLPCRWHLTIRFQDIPIHLIGLEG